MLSRRGTTAREHRAPRKRPDPPQRNKRQRCRLTFRAMLRKLAHQPARSPSLSRDVACNVSQPDTGKTQQATSLPCFSFSEEEPDRGLHHPLSQFFQWIFCAAPHYASAPQRQQHGAQHRVCEQDRADRMKQEIVSRDSGFP